MPNSFKIMAILNKEQLKEVAIDIFKRYPKAQKVQVADDGMAFIVDESDNAAKNHARNNGSGKVLELTPFTRDRIETGNNKPKSVEEFISLIGTAETVEDVEAIKAEETAGKKRKAILEAADARVKELNTSK